MKPIIMYRNSFVGGDGWTYHTMQIEIADTCPICGGPRGEPKSYRFHEDGEWRVVDQWDNPCGHVDTYFNAWKESEALKAEAE